MKQMICFCLLIAGALPESNSLSPKSFFIVNPFAGTNSGNQLNIQAPQEGSTKMRAAIFKAQEYCRAEVKDFEFEVQFKVVSAVVYFSGANFKNPEKVSITGSSLSAIKSQMNKCVPGSIVIFDEVKVLGPDGLTRTIPGVALQLI